VGEAVSLGVVGAVIESVGAGDGLAVGAGADVVASGVTGGDVGDGMLVVGSAGGVVGCAGVVCAMAAVDTMTAASEDNVRICIAAFLQNDVD
jgi:hypothetical protein